MGRIKLPSTCVFISVNFSITC